MATTQEIRNFIKQVRIEQDSRNAEKFALKSDITNIYRVKGTVADYSKLPTNAAVGDVYNITAAGGTDENGVAIKAGDNVVRTSTGWDNLGGTVDLSNYVEKVAGKQLSTNDFTDEYKNQLEGLVQTGGEVNVIESVKVNNTALAITNKSVNIDLSGKVDKVTGKQLSTNDYTTAEKTKLNGIAASAQVNVIESVKVNNTALAITSKAVNIDLTNYVQKDGSKVLSTNDYTNDDKNLLGSLSTAINTSFTQEDFNYIFAD